MSAAADSSCGELSEAKHLRSISVESVGSGNKAEILRFAQNDIKKTK
jgi:hypothetical protein